MKASPLLFVLLGACAMSASQAGGVVKPCDAEKAAALIDAPASPENGRKVLELTGARALRWIRPGMAVTMEYRADRANIYVEREDKIARITCG